MTVTFAGETPLARRFAAALAEASPCRARVPLDVYTAAFLAAEPSLVTSPERRRRLAAAIDELVESGIIAASRALDRSAAPPIPRFVVLLDRTADPSVSNEAAAYPWRPELAWAIHLPLRRSEFDALKAIQEFLRDRSSNAPIVPAGERSLELFGDEKRLDVIRQNRRLFRHGRLSLGLLRARAYPPPFAYRHVGDGPVALVLENVATYHSVLATLPQRCPIGLVIFGAGGNFAASVLHLVGLPIAKTISEIRYFGDLDRRGLEIPIAADIAAREAGLPAVRPAIGLWAELLRRGVRRSYVNVPPSVADHLATWLPNSLRDGARDVLIAGTRLAQETVGTEVLTRDLSWASWSGLGPPGVRRAGEPEPGLRRPSVLSMRVRTATDGEAALLLDDNGNRRIPTTEANWTEWVTAGATRNWVLGDPILDWLRLYGRSSGYVPDDERPDYDPRTDFRRFVLQKGIAFEAAVLDLLRQRAQLVQIADVPEDARSLDKARATIAALRAGVGIVAQAVLRNPDRQTYGVADLLVRSDLLASWFPELISADEAAIAAPGLSHHDFHYRVVDIKFHTFELSVDGHISNSPEQLAYGAQAAIYSEALDRIQGYAPGAAYLLGRTWRQGVHAGEGCLDRLARVDMDRWLPSREATIQGVVSEAISWIRRLRTVGDQWSVLPEPSVPELYPHARNTDDAPWDQAKREIAESLRELTLLPGMNPERRASAHAMGIKRWDDLRTTATLLGITSDSLSSRTDAVLLANRSTAPNVFPTRISGADDEWRHKPTVEFFVDFETVSNVDDDFHVLPRIGGQAQIAQIGCGHYDAQGAWQFEQWTADALEPNYERQIIDAWIAAMMAICIASGSTLQDARICHWSAAEPVNLDGAYNAARRRHPDTTWPSTLPWFDVLERVVRAAPVTVTGAFNFGLKSIAKAMNQLGLIPTTWSDGPTDGLGAMVGIWSAARECSDKRIRLSEHALVTEIARYNEIDCRAMAEVLGWLRHNR